jgi:hypothetical protein
MAESEVNRVLRDLDASFDAALARDEAAATADLTYSLLQGLDVAGAVRLWGSASVHLGSGRAVAIEEMGADFLAGAGGVLVPVGRAVVGRDSGPTPIHSTTTLIERLRVLARATTRATVRILGGTEYEGVLLHVRRDHLELGTRASALLIPLAMIDEIRTSGGG